MSADLTTLLIFTDGACSGNPGPGGWGTIVLAGNRVRELGGFQADSTNNKMELQATISGLRLLAPHAARTELGVEVRTDSQYVINGITKWVAGWKKKNWQSTTGPVKNRPLWEELDLLAAAWGKRIQWSYVRGHSGDLGNERCDAIAVAFSKGLSPALYAGERSGYHYGATARGV